MNPEDMQDPAVNNLEDMSPDEAAASLSFATMLQEGMMPQAPMEGEEVEEQPVEEQVVEEKPEKNIEAEPLPENDEFETKVLDEIAEIKAEIQELIDEEDEEEVKEEPQKDGQEK